MPSLEVGGSGVLVSALEQITLIDKSISDMEQSIKGLRERRESLEKIAIEEMTTERLEGVRAASRSWRVEYSHHMSVPADSRDAVLDAARAEGWESDVKQVNTLRLKALLAERARDAGTDARSSFVSGTRFDGLVGEFVKPVLRHVAVR